jgi:hypothetical protein
MPGLIRGVARTAVIAGTATAVSNNVSRRQQGRWASQNQQAQAAAAYEAQQRQAAYAAQQAQVAPPAPPAPPPAAAAPSMEEKIAQLQQLGELKAAGVLTEAEFDAQKQRILAG